MRLIDADALPRLTQIFEANGKRREQEVVLSKIIDKAPTIEAVLVVRCKDCKYYETPKNFKKPYCMRGAYVKVNADDYCSKGERK